MSLNSALAKDPDDPWQNAHDLKAANVTLISGVRNYYVVSADGQRILANTAAQAGASRPITVVLNWTAALPGP